MRTRVGDTFICYVHPRALISPLKMHICEGGACYSCVLVAVGLRENRVSTLYSPPVCVFSVRPHVHVVFADVPCRELLHCNVHSGLVMRGRRCDQGGIWVACLDGGPRRATPAWSTISTLSVEGKS